MGTEDGSWREMPWNLENPEANGELAAVEV